jgi:hypothetical protein
MAIFFLVSNVAVSRNAVHNLSIDRFHLSSRLLDGKVFADPLSTAIAHISSAVGISNNLTNALSHRRGVAHGYQNSCFGVLDEFGNASTVCGDNGLAGAHRFNDHLSEGFADRRCMYDEIHTSYKGMDVAAETSESYYIRYSKLRGQAAYVTVIFDFTKQGGADNQKPSIRNPTANERSRLEENVLPLPGRDPTDQGYLNRPIGFAGCVFVLVGTIRAIVDNETPPDGAGGIAGQNGQAQRSEGSI